MNLKLKIQCLKILRMMNEPMFSSLVTTLHAFRNTKYGLSVVPTNTIINVNANLKPWNRLYKRLLLCYMSNNSNSEPTSSA